MATGDYYNLNSKAYFEATATLDVSHLYKEFVPLVQPAGRILDAGCGSGRDSVAFKRLGFQVTSIDASPNLAQEAEKNLGVHVQVLRFDGMSFREEFDGIWASASLLHVPMAELEAVIGQFVEGLKIGGVWYFSFKSGTGEEEVDGRHFLRMNAGSIHRLLVKFPCLSLIKMWETPDVRGECRETWIHVLVKRQAH